jgi:predicted nicotinamide N-methyase
LPSDWHQNPADFLHSEPPFMRLSRRRESGPSLSRISALALPLCETIFMRTGWLGGAAKARTISPQPPRGFIRTPGQPQGFIPRN